MSKDYCNYVPMNVDYVDHMGTDLSVVNAARVSFAKESKEFSDKDSGLIRFLARENHKSPFNHTFASFRVKAPIFVARQLVKHEYMPWNEESRRYIDGEPEFYFPDAWRGRAKNVKQGSSDETINLRLIGVNGDAPPHPSGWEADLEERFYLDQRDNLHTYKAMLTAGVSPEQARMVLPLNTMTEWIWSGTVFAIAKMYNLRADPHAQYEAQVVARAIGAHMARLYPVSWKALTET